MLPRLLHAYTENTIIEGKIISVVMLSCQLVDIPISREAPPWLVHIDLPLK